MSHTPETMSCDKYNFKTVDNFEPKDMETHRNQHHTVQQFTCKVCSEKFTTEINLIEHGTTHGYTQHQAVEAFANCDVCNIIFTDVERYVFF